MNNSFKDLLDEEPIPENILRKVEQKVNGTAERARFVGTTSDLYISKVGKTLAAFFGGGDTPKRYGRSSAIADRNNTPPGGNHGN
jgi:hypothetical protein